MGYIKSVTNNDESENTKPNMRYTANPPANACFSGEHDSSVHGIFQT